MEVTLYKKNKRIKKEQQDSLEIVMQPVNEGALSKTFALKPSHF